MSVLNQSGEEQVECPLCMEPLEVDDLHFYPCTCGYQICRFCWNRIREGENGLCPACRKAYPENPADFTPLSQEQVAAIKTEKKAREQKRRNKTLESRRALANVRVVQNNLVFVVGLPVRLADPEILKRQEYFGKYGKIHKVVINQSTAYAGSQGPSASAYVTYVTPADALRAIQGVNNVTLDGRVLKGSLGTTKYCANFMKNQPCPKPDCMYLHDLGDPKASFTKEEMHAGLHQVYERKLHNQLLQQRDPKDDKQYNGSGNSITNPEKSSSKDGNQSNFIPTTVVTSSHINVVNSSKSNKKDQNGSSINGSGSSNSSGSGSSSGASSSTGKEAWPSLGASPPADSPARKHSPKPQHTTVKSQENGTSESSSPTLVQQQSQSKSKDHTDTKSSRSNKENSGTNGQSRKKGDKKHKSPANDTDEEEKTTYNSQTHSVFESETNFLSNELDELESDRHSLLENHDLLDNSDHSLLEDDNTHNLLNDANNEVMMIQRHREMLAGLVETNHIHPHMKSPLVNGYGLLDRDTMSYLGNDRQISQMSQSLAEQKEPMRPLNRGSLLLRHEPFLNSPHRDDATQILGANYHPNPNMLPPFGMRVDNSMGTSMPSGLPQNMPSGNMSSNMTGNMSSNMTGNMSSNMTGNMSGNISGSISGAMSSALSGMSGAMGGFMLHNQQMMSQQVPQAGMVNGFDSAQSASEGRYQAETMDKFFTDFRQAQQLRHARDERFPEPRSLPRNVLSAVRLEMEHKQRMSNLRTAEGNGARAAGDGDDDLDFDPFKETQKALAEMMETEMMQNTVSSGDSLRRRAPPGFGPAGAFPQPAPHSRVNTHSQGYNSTSAAFSDWTAMDPAIMSTSVSLSKPPPALGAPALSQSQQELFARFHQLPQGMPPNGLNKHKVPLMHGWSGAGAASGWPAAPLHMQSVQSMQSLSANAYNMGIPLPPGFAPAKPPQHPAECIDAK